MLPIISLLAIAEYPTFVLIFISIFIAICFYIYERAKENQAVTIKNTDLKKDKELSQKTLIKNSLYFSKNTQPIMVLDRKYIIISSNEAFSTVSLDLNLSFNFVPLFTLFIST